MAIIQRQAHWALYFPFSFFDFPYLFLNTYPLHMIGLFDWYCSNIFLLFLNTYSLEMIGLFHWYCSNILLLFMNTYSLGMIELFHWYCLNILLLFLEYLLPGNDWIIPLVLI